MIRTDAQGRPLEPPQPPPHDAPIEAKVAWLQADAAFRDRVSALANRAFSKEFHKRIQALRR